MGIFVSKNKSASAEDVAWLEEAYEKLQSSDECHSLLKKHLTKAVLNQIKTKKTPTFGSTLKDVIQSGVENLDSGVGVYAPDFEAYTTFSPLLDPIIGDYHFGDPKARLRQPAMSLGDASAFSDLDPDGTFVVSTRVRCGRNLAQMPFNPNMTENDYLKLEEIMSEKLGELDGELKGTYKSLSSMSDEEKDELISGHLMFKEGDRFLQAANACRFWPTGRGFFANEDNTFIVWVGEEDHVRIISMQKGGNLGEVYGRLVTAITAMSNLKFARDPRLGFLTFCPTNLGTTIRASVHIKLPKLAENGADELQKVADQYNLQVRGSSGEHSDTSDGLFDVSNRERLGLTEFAAVKKMFDGVAALINMEKDLMNGGPAEAEAEAAAPEAEPEPEPEAEAAPEDVEDAE